MAVRGKNIDNGEAEKPGERFKRLILIFFTRFIDLIKAVLVRILMTVTIFILTWRAASVNNAQLPSDFGQLSSVLSSSSDKSNTTTVDTLAGQSGVTALPSYAYWFPLFGIALFIPEFIFTLFLNRSHEYKWWSPAMTIFAVCSLASIWMIEIHLYTKKWEGIVRMPNASSFEELSVFEPELFGQISHFDFGGVMFNEYEWAHILEQFFFIMIIVAKWLLPKGVMSRDQLSQLLLVYIAMATDILDIIDSLMFVGIGDVLSYTVAVLVIYSLPHIQFAINYTATLSSNSRFVKLRPDMPEGRKKFIRITCFCFQNDIWAMLFTIFLQDGPFFVIRLFFIFEKHIITFANIFFAVKNGMVLTMDVYRVIGIVIDEFFSKPEDNEWADCDEEIRHGRFGVYEKVKEQPEDNEFVNNSNRAEIRLTINADNTVKGVAEFVVAKELDDGDSNENENEDDSEERVKQKTWRKLRAKACLQDDGAMHVLYEIDMVLDKDCISADQQIDAVYFKDVRLQNITMEQGGGAFSAASSRRRSAVSSANKMSSPQQQRRPTTRISTNRLIPTTRPVVINEQQTRPTRVDPWSSTHV